LLVNFSENPKVKQMIAISEGWYTISQINGQLNYNDLQFGLVSLKTGAENFVFQYKIEQNADGKVSFAEVPKNSNDGKQLLIALWSRLQGNWTLLFFRNTIKSSLPFRFSIEL